MNAPKLRFEGFNDDWKITPLSDLMSFNNGINADKDSYGHGRKFINVLDILNNSSIKYDDIIGSVSVSQKVEDTNKVQYGDLLFLRSSETRVDVGKSSVYLDKNEFALFGGFVIRGKKQGEYQPYFLKLNLESPRIRHQIGSKAGGSTRFNVSQSILCSIDVSMPSQNEQQKIAEFMTFFDQKIKLQQEKIDLLKKQKKGFTQKIFNHELRFRNENGQLFSEWKVIPLSEFSNFSTGANKNDFIEEKGNLLIMDMGSVSSEGRIIASKRTDANSDLLQKGDLIMPKDDIGGGKIIGLTAYINQDNRYILGDHVYLIKMNKNICNPLFAHYQFQSQYFRKKLKRLVTGSAQLGITSTNIMKESFNIPSLEEQNKIAHFLSMFDKKIVIEENSLKLLMNEKQAFMQKMFI